MKTRLIVFTGLLLLPLLLPAQDFDAQRAALNQRQEKAREDINRLKSQIQQYERKITETDRKFDKLEKQFESMVRETALRRQLLSKLNTEQRHILEEIALTEANYRQYEEKLAVLTERYRKSLRYLYIHGRTSETALLWTSESINQLLARSYYLKRFGTERDRQVRIIENSKTELRYKAAQLDTVKKKNNSIIEETEAEKKRLESRKQQQEKTIKLMEKDRKNLQNKVKEINRQLNNLNKVLTDLIREEERIREAEAARARALEAERLKRLAEAQKIRDAKEREKQVAKYREPEPVVAKVAGTISNEELAVIEKNFVSQRGKLPWPVEGGAVSAKFGTKVHPVYKTRIDNPGIEITIEPGTAVKAVHDGYVMSIQPITGFGDVVIVNHGRYKSVYGNLSAVNVQKMAPVIKGDVIGLSGDENSAKGPVVFFMIWEKGKNIDPETWISRR